MICPDSRPWRQWLTWVQDLQGLTEVQLEPFRRWAEGEPGPAECLECPCCWYDVNVVGGQECPKCGMVVPQKPPLQRCRQMEQRRIGSSAMEADLQYQGGGGPGDA